LGYGMKTKKHDNFSAQSIWKHIISNTERIIILKYIWYGSGYGLVVATVSTVFRL
jgi:hypothetical protein